MESDLEDTLQNRINEFKQLAGEDFARIIQASSGPAKTWVCLPQNGTPDTKNPAHIRRFGYAYKRILETLRQLESIDGLGKAGIDRDDVETVRKRFQSRKQDWEDDLRRNGSPHPLSDAEHPFTLAQVIRRLHADAEFEPLRLSALDPELFTACFILRSYEQQLLPNERAQVYKRIWHELQAYVDEEREYYDLSTVWWGMAVITSWSPVPDKEKLDTLRKLLDLALRNGSTPSGNTALSDHVLLTQGGERKKHLEQNGDMTTPFRSAVFCHLNAVQTRKWVESLRDPRLVPATQQLREWADCCAEACCIAGPSDKSEHPLYDAALRLAFLSEWWEDRVQSWDRAIEIIRSGTRSITNASSLPTITTSHEAYARKAEQVVADVKGFRESQHEKRPFVVALFGPPGAGKSTLAKAAAEDTSICEVNMSVLDDPGDFCSLVEDWISHNEKEKRPVVFLDEFDAGLKGEYWYKWLLSLLWDGKYIVRHNSVPMLTDLPRPLTVFLAASRYETYSDFRDFALSPQAQEHKAADLLTRIDAWVNIPRLKPDDRVLVMENAAQKVRDGVRADNELLALSYMAELEDNARGIVKLLKGVDLGTSSNRCSAADLLTTARNRLFTSAGLPPPEDVSDPVALSPEDLIPAPRACCRP